MSYTRNIKRTREKEVKRHLAQLAILLSRYYEFLSSRPQPSDEAVRERFISFDKRWRRYCANHKLMNADHLFVLNVQEAWKRHTRPAAKSM